MSLNILSAKITGTPNDSGWTQVHEFKPEDPEKLEKRGHLFAVIGTKKKEEGITSVAAGRELLSRLHEEYFGNLEGTPFSVLKNAVAKVIKEFSETWGDVEIVTAAIVDDVVYSAACGGGKVCIYRRGGIATILESGKEEVAVASGYPKEGDYLILGTKSFFGCLSPGVLKASLEGPSISASAESLAPIVSSSPDSGNMGVVIVGFSQETVIEKVAEAVSPPSFQKPANISFRGITKKITTLFTKFLPERKIFVRTKNLDDQAGVGKKTTFYVGISLLILLFVSIGFGIKQNLTKKYKETYQEELSQAINNLDEAETAILTDPKKARELFLDSKSKVDNLLSKKIEDKEISSLNERLNEKESEILGIYKEEPSLYLDLSLLSSGFGGDKIIFSGGNIFVFDKNGKKVVKIIMDTKKTQIVAGPEQLDGSGDIFAYQDSVYGVFSDGIYSLGTAKKKVVEKTWEGEILTYAYTGNIYILDKTANIIWRYQGSGDGFGTKQNWIAPKITPDFKNAKQIAIDGTIWILTDTFNIARFSQGSPQAFKAQGVYPNIQNITAIHTNEENTYIYLLDKEGGRVIVLEKNGSYKAQYQSDKFKEGKELIVSEKTQKAIILTKEKLIQINLKHF